MSNLDRDAVQRSLDHNGAMERLNRPEGDFKYPLGAIVVIALIAFAIYTISAWVRS